MLAGIQPFPTDSQILTDNSRRGERHVGTAHEKARVVPGTIGFLTFGPSTRTRDRRLSTRRGHGRNRPGTGESRRRLRITADHFRHQPPDLVRQRIERTGRLLNSLHTDVRVMGRGPQVAVSHDLLNRAQINPGFQHMGRETVRRVGRHMLR